MVTRIEIDDSSGRVTGVRYVHNGTERVQRADAVAVAGYSIETPRLLLNSVSRRFAHGLANNNDQVGRCVMVQGAPQVAGRFPDEMRMYKMPPPEISSEQFYETDPHRGFARGFSIQTVGLSVVDSDHRAWEVPNLFIADGSVMPTQGAANPALTIMARASRLAERLDHKRLDARQPVRDVLQIGDELLHHPLSIFILRAQDRGRMRRDRHQLREI